MIIGLTYVQARDRHAMPPPPPPPPQPKPEKSKRKELRLSPNQLVLRLKNRENIHTPTSSQVEEDGTEVTYSQDSYSVDSLPIRGARHVSKRRGRERSTSPSAKPAPPAAERASTKRASESKAVKESSPYYNNQRVVYTKTHSNTHLREPKSRATNQPTRGESSSHRRQATRGAEEVETRSIRLPKAPTYTYDEYVRQHTEVRSPPESVTTFKPPPPPPPPPSSTASSVSEHKHVKWKDQVPSRSVRAPRREEHNERDDDAWSNGAFDLWDDDSDRESRSKHHSTRTRTVRISSRSPSPRRVTRIQSRSPSPRRVIRVVRSGSPSQRPTGGSGVQSRSQSPVRRIRVRSKSPSRQDKRQGRISSRRGGEPSMSGARGGWGATRNGSRSRSRSRERDDGW
jgi:hypothetical protein